MNRFDRRLPDDGAFGFGDLLVDALECASGPVGAVLVVDDLFAAGAVRPTRPGLSQRQPVRDLGVRVVPAPFVDDVGDVTDPVAQDEPQPGGLDRLLVRLGQHPGVGDDRDVGEPVRGHERLQRGQHGGRLGLVPLEGLHRQRKPARVGEQADGDLRVQPAFLGEPRLPKPVTDVGLEVERGDVVEHQTGRA
jgi:hypothetical protein